MNLSNIEQFLTIRNFLILLFILTLVLMALTQLGILPPASRYPGPAPPPPPNQQQHKDTSRVPVPNIVLVSFFVVTRPELTTVATLDSAKTVNQRIPHLPHVARAHGQHQVAAAGGIAQVLGCLGQCRLIRNLGVMGGNFSH